jgi:hypothetical protein
MTARKARPAPAADAKAEPRGAKARSMKVTAASKIYHHESTVLADKAQEICWQLART